MSAVCPTCGVAVVPGYVKCPKCRARLPSFRIGAARSEGGTALVERGGFPLAAVLVPAVLVVGIVVYFGFIRGSGSKPAEAAKPAVTEPVAAPAAGSARLDPGVVPTTPTAPTGPSLQTVATTFETTLQRQRLWGTVEIVGSRVDVRSNSCSEPTMAPTVDGVRGQFGAAGATQIRCLLPSGSVVFTRDL